MPVRPLRFRRPAPTLLALALAGGLAVPLAAHAQEAGDLEAMTPPAAAEPAPPVQPSAMDANLFYQLLVGEMEARAGRVPNAFEIVLDGARRTQDPRLFQRAVELALQSRSGDRALQAVRAWRQAQPESMEALRMQVQLLSALNRPEELGPALLQLLRQAPEAERPGLISTVPRFLAGLPDKARALSAGEMALSEFLRPQPGPPDARTAARIALGRLALAAGQPAQALAQARQAASDDNDALAPALLALELMPVVDGAEPLVLMRLQGPGPAAPLRMAYARALEMQQRIAEAVEQMQLALQDDPAQPRAWLALANHLVDLRRPQEALQALDQQAAQAERSPAAAPASGGEDDEDERADLQQRTADFSVLLRAQAQMQLGLLEAAGQTLATLPVARDDLAAAQQRAELLRRQGRLDQARTLLREAPLQGRADERARLLAESALLREAQRWSDAYELLLSGVRRAPDDSALIYELAMVAERLGRFDDMEVLLNRVMAIKPEDAHAFNALGYSLAERGQRLDEAETLLGKALALAPRDAFIIDSLGWLRFRQGRPEEALPLLRQAWRQRPHAEVATHLAEVLWSVGQQEQARGLWREALRLEPESPVLRETLQRLKVGL